MSKKCCYKIEDTYGCFSIISKYKYTNNSNDLQFNENEHYLKGLKCPGVFSISSLMISYYKGLGVDTIVHIFDLDNVSGDKSKLLTSKDFEKHAKDSKNVLELYGIKSVYLPVVYCAESIALLSYMDTDVTEITHTNIKNNKDMSNTTDLHLNLLMYYGRDVITDYKNNNPKMDDKRIAKRTYLFMDYNKLENNIRKYLSSNNPNELFYRWLLNNCSINNVDEFYDYNSTIEFLDNINNRYDNRKDYVLELNSTKINMNKDIPDIINDMRINNTSNDLFNKLMKSASMR